MYAGPKPLVIGPLGIIRGAEQGAAVLLPGLLRLRQSDWRTVGQALIPVKPSQQSGGVLRVMPSPYAPHSGSWLRWANHSGLSGTRHWSLETGNSVQMSQVLIHRRGAEDAEKTNESTLRPRRLCGEPSGRSEVEPRQVSRTSSMDGPAFLWCGRPGGVSRCALAGPRGQQETSRVQILGRYAVRQGALPSLFSVAGTHLTSQSMIF